ncbi:hypothetical protein [Schlesneria paludicola]|uniref:hypothetical protein n=1 Tax=Schlesneria paludicola TaxID=360056 RepID=UPI00029A17BF|nr:hypothetical protein [Schlesneria paludicola]
MSSLPPVSEVIDASLNIVLPAFLTTAIATVCGWKILNTRYVYLTAALAIVLGLLAANLCRGVFVTRFDAEKPLAIEQWGRGLLAALVGQPAQQESAESEDEATANGPDTEITSATTKSPRSGRYWIPAAIGIVVVVELLAKSLKCPARWLQLSRLAASFVAARLFVPADLAVEYPWVSWLAGGIVFLGWWVADRLSVQMRSGVASVCTVVASFAAATILIHAHSARLTDAATMLMAATGGLATAALWRGGQTASAAPIGAVFLPAILLAGYHETFSEVPTTAFLLPAVAPLSAGLALALPGPWRQSWRGLITIAICVGLPAMVSVALAMRAESLSF